MTVPETTLTALKLAGQAAADKQATDIVAVDVAERMGLTDAFLIASAGSERQVLSVVDEIEDVLSRQLQLDVTRREGKAGGRWVLLDYGHFVVHVQHEEERVFYALDRLWKDAPLVDLGLTDGVAEDEAGSAVTPTADWTPSAAGLTPPAPTPDTAEDPSPGATAEDSMDAASDAGPDDSTADSTADYTDTDDR